MSNLNSKKKNLIDLIGVTKPLSVTSGAEITEKRKAALKTSRHKVIYAAAIETLLKESARDLKNLPAEEEQPVAAAEEPAVEKPVEAAAEKPVEPVANPIVAEAQPAPVEKESAAPVAESKKTIDQDSGLEDDYDEDRSLETSQKEVIPDAPAYPVAGPASDQPASYWLELSLYEEKYRGRFFSLAKELSTFSNWDRKQFAKTRFEQNLVDRNIILSVRHLKKFFTLGSGLHKTKLKAVHDVSFDIKKGEVFGIVGESGCGKTTTGRTIMRLYNATSGSVYFMGYRIGAGSRWNEKEIKWKRKRGNDRIRKLQSDLNAELRDPDTDSNTKAAIAKRYRAEIEKTRRQIKATVKEQREKIRANHHDEKNVSKHLLTKMQMIFQDPIDSLDPRMTVQDIVAEGLKIQKFAKNETERLKANWNEEVERLMKSDLPDSVKELKKSYIAYNFNRLIAKAHDYKGMVAETLTKVGLIPDYANRYPHEFSGGQRQRIGIARALIMKPELIIADEPISALDVSIRAQIINLLNNLRDEMGLTIVFIAHDLSVVKYFCERIAVMYYGNLVELATSDELFKHPLHPYTKSLLSAIPKPDPLSEKKRIRIRYDASKDHDYTRQGPRLQEIVPGHYVLANDAEMAKYRQEIVEDDKALVAKEAEDKQFD